MAVRPVVQIGHPALKAVNQTIADFHSPRLRRLIKDLTDTMHDNGLIGIAAPQVAKNYRVFVTHVRNTGSRKLTRSDRMRVYINPTIAYFSRDKQIIYEGCGSVAFGELFAPVRRPVRVVIEANDETGTRFSLTCDGILSRVIQHEYDHLSGIEFTEKIADYRQILFRDFYLKNIKNSKAQKHAVRVTTCFWKRIG